ncbi:hypothetical protein [uncultured Murdochiella sp.]|uniref:hypothetical protein n=1 Tax=uncultured Murdochiella sp. TaxID=1586095 RepID=UPI0028050D76|nr:hypothetical protein [uncultured Murdochiella sp.]
MAVLDPGKSRNWTFARGVPLRSTPGYRLKRRFARGALRLSTLASREIGRLPGVFPFVRPLANG